MTVMLFPGQGSQYPGMGRDLSAFGPAAQELVESAQQATGLPVRQLMTTADAATLADPQVAQVLVFVWSGIALRALRERGWSARAVAGHSLGEYTALVACGCLDWDTALELVAHRGRLMAQAARLRPGTMGAVVGLARARVAQLCADASTGEELVVLANVNSARQIVVSGTTTAVETVLARAADHGALRARRLPVGGAYHSPLMAPAELDLAPFIRRAPLAPPALTLVSSVNGVAVTDLDAYRELLIGQITSPVNWQAVTAAMATAPEFVEVGPGRVLGGLGRETLRGARHLTALEAVRVSRSVEMSVS